MAGQITITLRIAPGMRIEIMLTAVNLDDELVFETDKIDHIAVAWSLSAEVEAPFSP